jgi:hypothetical protein
VAQTVTEPIGQPEPERKPLERQSTVELLRSISNDTVVLIRKEIELAKQEISKTVQNKAMGAAALAAGGLMGLYILGFLGLAAGAALAYVVPRWAAWLIVAGVYMLIAAGAAMFGIRQMKKGPNGPEETKRTVKEDVEWARAQLKR